MDEPCRCGGRNPYCSFCDGSGFVSPPATFRAAPRLQRVPDERPPRAVRVTRSLFIRGRLVTVVVEDDGGSHLLCVVCNKHVLRNRLLTHARQSHENRKRCRVCSKMLKASSLHRHFAAAHSPLARTDRGAKTVKRRKRKPTKRKSPKKRIKGASLQRVKQGRSDRGWRGRRI
jgi:hypothetical protein